MLHFSAQTLAGSQITGSADGPCDSASFFRPCGLASVNRIIFVTDRSNGKSIRVVAEGQVCSLNFSDGQELSSAGDIAYYENHLFICDRGNDCIQTVFLGPDFEALAASQFLQYVQERTFELKELQITGLRRPNGLYLSPEYIFVSDTGNRRVVRAPISVDGSDSSDISVEEIEQVCVLQQPQALARLSQSVLAVADQLAHCIYTIDLQNPSAKPRILLGQFNFPGDGSKTLRSPSNICCFRNYLFVCEKDSSQIRFADLSQKQPSLTNITYGRGYLDGPKPKVDEPAGMFAYQNKNGLNLIVCDCKNSVLRILSTSIDDLQEYENEGRSVPPIVDTQKDSSAPAEQLSVSGVRSDALPDQFCSQRDNSGSQNSAVFTRFNFKIPPFRAVSAVLKQKVQNTQLSSSPVQQILDALLQRDKERLTPLAAGYIDYYTELDPLEHNGQMDKKLLMEYPECDRNNIWALDLLRHVLQEALLDYDQKLLSHAVSNPETHALMLARTVSSGICVKSSLTIDGTMVELNCQNQFILPQISIQNGPVDVEVNLWIVSSREKDYAGGARVALCRGILSSDRRRAGDPVYLEGRPAKCKRFPGANFWGRLSFQVDAVELKEFSKKLSSKDGSYTEIGADSIFQIIEIQIGQAKPLRVGLEFGLGQEKDNQPELAREFQLERRSCAVFV